MSLNIKDMQLYPSAERILVDLRSRGVADDQPVDIELLSQIDQLHYHGTAALDDALAILDLSSSSIALEIGSGWGGPSRYLAHRSGAHIDALELQSDFHGVGQGLTQRAGLAGAVTHINGDFHKVDITPDTYDAVVSWLALYHIPDRPRVLTRSYDALKPGGMFFTEDLTGLNEITEADAKDLQHHLFANTLYTFDEYANSLYAAGFTDINCVDMTDDWNAFTADRLVEFKANQLAIAAVFGAAVYAELLVFYTKVAKHFEQRSIGGIRAFARKPT